MFRSRNYYDDAGFMAFLGWLLDMAFATVGFILALILVVSSVVAGVIWIFAGPECRAKGEKMSLNVDWAFHSGCMINIKDQWLPWSEVVPVEKDGKIVFTPKANTK